MYKVSASNLRKEISEIIARVEHRGEDVIVQRYGKNVAAIVPLDSAIEIEQIKNRKQIKKLREILKNEELQDWNEVKKTL